MTKRKIASTKRKSKKVQSRSKQTKKQVKNKVTKKGTKKNNKRKTKHAARTQKTSTKKARQNLKQKKKIKKGTKKEVTEYKILLVMSLLALILGVFFIGKPADVVTNLTAAAVIDIQNAVDSPTKLWISTGSFALAVLLTVTVLFQIQGRKVLPVQVSNKEVFKIRPNETKIDALYRHVQEKGKVSLTDAVQTLSANKDLIKEWAEILETHDLIAIEYPTFGSMVLTKPEERKEEKE